MKVNYFYFRPVTFHGRQNKIKLPRRENSFQPLKYVNGLIYLFLSLHFLLYLIISASLNNLFSFKYRNTSLWLCIQKWWCYTSTVSPTSKYWDSLSFLFPIVVRPHVMSCPSLMMCSTDREETLWWLPFRTPERNGEMYLTLKKIIEPVSYSSASLDLPSLISLWYLRRHLVILPGNHLWINKVHVEKRIEMSGNTHFVSIT